MAIRPHICICLGGKVIASHLILSSRDHRVVLHIYCLLSRRAKVLRYQPIAGDEDKGKAPSSEEEYDRWTPSLKSFMRGLKLFSSWLCLEI